VRDPGRLATLFARGEAAERKAIDAVNAAILEVVKPAGAIIARMPAVMAGLGAIGENLDREATLFTPAYQHVLAGVLNRWWSRQGNDCKPSIEWRQDRLLGWLSCAFRDSQTVRTTSRLGGVTTFAIFDSERRDGLALVNEGDLLERIWQSVHDLLVGFAPDTHEAMFSLHVVRNDTEVFSVDRQLSLEEPTQPTVDSIRRELRRTRGEQVWEP